MSKIKEFFSKIKPSKRKIIQLYAALLYNAHMKGFITGEIYTGDSKSICLPGFNCYACPGAVGACPLGSIQNALAESKTKLPTYVLGIILLYCIIFGRTICGFLCPVGLLQELLYKIKTPKLKKSKVTRCLSYFKYVLLFVLVIGLPLIYGLQAKGIPLPGFCKYICPAGTFEGAIFLLFNEGNAHLMEGLGTLFTWKFFLLIVFIVASVFIYRFFCRFFCPLGAIYGIFNKLSILGVKVEKSKCNHCNQCINNCKMDVKEVGDHECIQCGDCMKSCACKAIKWKLISKIIKEDEAKANQIESNDTVTSIDEADQKTTFKIKRKTFNIITYTFMIVSLTIVMVLVNLDTKRYKINDVIKEVEITCNDGTKFNFDTDENSTLLYFYETITEEDLEVFKNYSHEKLNIILLQSKESSESPSNEYLDYNIYFSYDKDNKLRNQFTKEKNTPYSVFLNFDDKLLISQNKVISNEDYFNIINISLLGLSIGNKVGDICLNQTINLVASDETFSVAGNRGKITVINFWYTTCTPCVQELPHFNKIYEEYKEYIEVIAIHEARGYKNNPSAVEQFVNTTFEGFTIKFGYDVSIDGTYNDTYFKKLGGGADFPYTIIVNEEGVITSVVSNSITEEDLREAIRKEIE